MPRSSVDRAPPACFALTVPGLEAITAQEIEEDLGGTVKKTMSGIVVFRVEPLDKRVLELRTAEDIFLLAWGSDQLTYRAKDLDLLQRWTAKEPNWPLLFEYHRAIRPKPKGKPSYHLVAQLHGEHGYRRTDMLEVLEKGLRGKLPNHLLPVSEEAQIEIWLRVMGKRAICGLRLSDQRMRHRTYKTEHVQASLRPVVAAAMLRVSNHPDGLLVDPCCGAGTILAEELSRNRGSEMIGGDIDKNTLVAAWSNLRHWHGNPRLVRWDARELPLPNNSIASIVTNPPLGKQLKRPEEIGSFYHALIQEWDRVLQPGGLATVLVSDLPAMQQAAWNISWQQEGLYRIRLLGHPAAITVWRKGYSSQ